jgi:hypothetical protein
MSGVFLNHKASMMHKMVFGISVIVKGLTRGSQKSSMEIQKLFRVFRKEF